MDQDARFNESAYAARVMAGEEELRPSHIATTRMDYRKRALDEMHLEGDWGWAMHCLYRYFVGDYECYRYGVPDEQPHERGYELVRSHTLAKK